VRLAIAVAGLIFVGLAASVAWHLSQPYLPARHLDPAGCTLTTLDGARAELRVTALHVAAEATIELDVKPEVEGPWRVDVHARTRKPDEPAHQGTVVVTRELPAVAAVILFDRRWAHPSEHPEGLLLDATAAP
jgi:hypothetical protein